MKLTVKEKYDFYERSVQNPEVEVEFMTAEFKRFYKRAPLLMREDFCGTGAISCKWVEEHKNGEAFGIDLDPEPIAIGKERHYSKLKASEKKRMHYVLENVFKVKTPKMDVICAFNFSYFFFKGRKDLLNYFKTVKKSLNKEGLFFVDIFGGPESQKLVTDKKILKNLTYYWECQKFNPITHECLFAIHFRDKKGKMHKNVFSYDWRFWMMPEVRDIMIEAGFSEVTAYWEGDDDDGGGDGDFKPSTEGENCDAWVSYLVAHA